MRLTAVHGVGFIAILIVLALVNTFVGPHWFGMGASAIVEEKNTTIAIVNVPGVGNMTATDAVAYLLKHPADNQNKPKENETLDDSQKPPATTTATAYGIGDFKDWVNGKLTVNTDVSEITVLDQDKAQSIISDAWDTHHDKKWNVDTLSVKFANEYGDNDPIESIFFTSSDIFVVTKKANGIPQVWTPDKDGNLQKVSSKKTVYGMDKLSKTG